MYYQTIFLAVTIGLLGVVGCVQDSVEKNTHRTENAPALSWQEDDHSLSLLNEGDVVWRLNYDKSEDKPYFYPLRTLDGTNLALQRPDDHPWHRGLWFSWKKINALNYWEEDPETGLSAGRTKIEKVEMQLNEDFSAEISFELAYRPDDGDPIMLEHRVLTISKPDEHGNYRIDWIHQFSAQEGDLLLDREVPLKHGGVSWGGYAGLSYRANDTDLTSIRYLDSNNWKRSESLTGYGEDANWMDLSGMVTNTSEEGAGLAIFDHPSNPRHPSPWYVWFEKGEHAFFMPAFLFNEAYNLKGGETFSLRYRVLVHQGLGSFEALNHEYESYIQ